jgi:hypothetical protein
VIATFTERDEAQAAARRLDAEGDDTIEVVLGDREDVLDALAVNQRAEIGDAAMAPSVSLWSGPMVRGALVWGVAGLVLGAALALPLLLVVGWPDDDRWLFVASVAAIGALGTSTVTFLVGAVRRAQKEGEFTPEDPWAVVKVRMPDERAAWVTEQLVEAGARSVRRLERAVRRPSSDDVETPRISHGPAATDHWPASQRGARSDSA